MIVKRFEYLLPKPAKITGTRVELFNHEKVIKRDIKNEAGVTIGTEELKGKDLFMAQGDALMKRFKRAVISSGKLEDYRKHEAFTPKGLRRKEKAKQAKIRRIKLQKKHKNSQKYFSQQG